MLEVLLLLPLCYLLYEQQQAYMGYVKDDTFISMRYARNFAEGHGLVFNYGEKLEGYTNFLWVMLTVPAYWLKVDPLTWVKTMGCFFGQLGVFVTWAIGRHLSGGRSDPFGWLAAAGYAFSASVVLWSTAGLEPTLMAVLCSGGTLLAMMLASARPGAAGNRKLAIAAGLVLAFAGLGRPDAHAVVLIAAAAGVLDWLRRGRDATRFREWLLCAGVIAGVLAPYHGLRIAYFGELLPNTFYIKAAAGPEVWKQGLEFASGLLVFTANPYAFGAAGFALLATLGSVVWQRFGVGSVADAEDVEGQRVPADLDGATEVEPSIGSSFEVSPLPQGRRNFSRLWAAALAIFFFLYMVKIGRDEMKWYRLYLPVFPLLLALGSDGLRWIAFGTSGLFGRGVWDAPGRAGRGQRRRLWILWLPVSVALAWGAYQVNDELLDAKAAWHNTYVESSERSFQAMGRYIDERSKPGEVVLFQDMGAAPFAGGDLRWVDTIGILNHRVAREHAAIGLNPFMRGLKRSTPGGAQAISAMDKRLRNYFFEQEPSWIAMVAYVGKGGNKRKKMRRGFQRAVKKGDKSAQAKLFRSRVERNSHAHGIAKDKRFRTNFVYEKAWMRNRGGYWLVLYKRKPGASSPSGPEE